MAYVPATSIFFNALKPSSKKAKKDDNAPRIGFPKVKACFPGGSRYVCNPPVMDTDDDTFVLVEQLPNREEMKEKGWEFCEGDGASSYGGCPMWAAYRREEKNLILIADKDRYIQAVAATLLCKELNLMDKKDRVAVHEYMYGETGSITFPLPDKGLL